MRKEKLRIDLLGKPEVWLDGEHLTSFSTAKTEALLYYLAATGQMHSRETLAGLLWSEMSEAKARRNLTKSLSVLRRLLEPFLRIEPQRVGFDPDEPFVLDVTLLETAVSTTLDVLSLYRGDFLEGFFVKDALVFEEWQLAQREHLRETAIRLLEARIEQAMANRDYADGIVYGRRLLKLDPWRESAHRQLMLLLAKSGQHAAALAQYEQCQQVLADELGIEPMAETDALSQRIRAARHKPAFGLPYEATPLVGRERELAQIQQRLQDPDCRLLTITGLGGMGKTRLAIAAAHQVNQESALLFLNGVAFMPLAGVEGAAAVPLALANALDVPLSSAATPLRALQNFLRNQEMLLILDNLEHLTGISELLLTLLQTCPDVKLLVTSRKSLDLASEWRIDLVGLPIPPEHEKESVVLDDYAAVALFVRSASQVNPQFQLSAKNGAQVGQLCRLVAGMPLALQLAATWLRTMPITAVLAELKRDLDILATDMQDVPPRQRSMRAIFESTWQMLSDEERQALETLSICRGGFTQETAAAIAEANPFLLRRLINRVLIYQQDESRYDMHPLTRQFAQEQLSISGNEEKVAAGHGRFFLPWLIEQAPALQGMKPQTSISKIKAELGNLQQAWKWALQTKQMELLPESLTALATFYDVLGLLQEGEAVAVSAISHLEEATTPQEERLLCHALITKCHFLTEQGQYEAAANALEMAQGRVKRVQDQELESDICHVYGRILTDTGKYNEAEHQFRQAISIYRRLQNERKTAKSLSHLGWNHIVDGDTDAALPLLQEALSLERKAGHKWGEAFALGNLAVVYGYKGEMETALTTQQQVLAAYEDLGDLLNIVRAENNYGMSLIGAGRYLEAVPHIQRAIELARQLRAEASLANALDSLGTAYLACGKYEKAKVCLEEALASALEIGYVYINYSVRAVLAKLFNRTGELARAAEQLQQLHPLASQLENGVYIARSLSEQAYLANTQGNLAQAEKLIMQAIEILRQNPAPQDLPFFLMQYAEYLVDLQRPAEAIPLAEEAITAARQLQHMPLEMYSCALAARLLMMLGDSEAAHLNANIVRQLLPKLRPYPDVLTGLLHLSHYCLATGNNLLAHLLSAFVANHSASSHTVRQQANVLLEEMEPPHRETLIDEWAELVTRLDQAAT
ncbi:AfsR/SARP family transcriptional regulator [Candidatus Leptofilum sp.]|uniref:AfsR/SARP family transcriptional regulator n=1 Tax=Candidatus Leptofilum sp. TaxID=3241576 RepID=UPI003B59D2F2